MSVQVKDQVALAFAQLEQMSGEELGRMYEIHATRVTLGRSSEADVVLDADGVSRVHALLVQSDGSWFIRDNNSKNGIFVNGKQVKESWLESGDMVQLGTFVFRFHPGVSNHLPEEGNLPQMADLGGALESMSVEPGMPSLAAQPSGKRPGMNPRIMVYVAVLLILGGYFMMGSGDGTQEAGTEQGTTVGPGGEKLARDFELAEKPSDAIGTKRVIPVGMEDPLLKKAEQEMTKLDWSNRTLQEAEQIFRRGQREYLTKNYHRAIDAFQTSLNLYGGHLLAERYLRRAIYEAEIEAKNEMGAAIQYYESLQYARAIHHFNEVIALMAHRPKEPIVQEAARYIKQSELRLKAAELFP